MRCVKLEFVRWKKKVPEVNVFRCNIALSEPCNLLHKTFLIFDKNKSKGLPQQAEVAQGFPGRLRSRILLMFGTTRVVGRQYCAPAAFTPGEILGTHF